MQADDYLALFKSFQFVPHDAQMSIVNSRTRFNLLSCGRRWGKTEIAAARGTALMGVGGRGWIVAPNYDLTRRTTRKMTGFLRHWKSHIKTMTRMPFSVELDTGGSCEAKTCENLDSLQGDGLDFIIFDEAATVQNPDAWLQYLRPTLADKLGCADFTSTPKGFTWYYDLWGLGCDPEEKDWSAFMFDSSTNPYLPLSEYEEARRSMPKRIFEQEWQGKFIADADSVFRVPDSIICARYLTQPIGGHYYVMGVDLAKSQDYSVLTVIDCQTREVVWLERFIDVEWPLQRARIQNLYRLFNCPICADATGKGEPVVSELIDMGLPVDGFLFTNASKQAIIVDLSMALENEELKIPNEPWLINELRSYQYQKTAAGNITMNAPVGKHDDGVISLALAWHIGISYIGISSPRAPKEELMRPPIPARLQIPKSITRR